MTTTLIIGANRGIGLELTKASLSRGDKVFATYRSKAGELESMDVTTVGNIDICDSESLKALQQLGEFDRVFINAGVLSNESLESLDFEQIAHQLNVNSIGPLRVVDAIRNQFKRGTKLVLMTSRMGSVADNSSGGFYGYRMSKSALNSAGRSLSLDLAKDNVCVLLMHPGYVRTDMTGGNGLIDADESATAIMKIVEDIKPEQNGTFWHSDGSVLPW